MFAIPESSEEWNKYRLCQEQIDAFHAIGYVAGIKLLDHEQVDTLRAELADLVDPDFPGNVLFHEYFSNESSDPNSILFHALGHWRIKPGFHDILWNPAFVMAASQLLGGSVRFWHDQLFYKPAKNGGVVAWHQDYSYWTRTVPMQHLTCWTGLDDADEDNGCLYYVPTSHKWGLLQKPELAGTMTGLFDYLTSEQKDSFKPIPIELERGYGVFHHPLLIHGSHENRTDRPRRAFVLNVVKDGVISDSDDPLLKGMSIVSTGHKLEGQFFPLLFDRSAS